MSRQRLDRRALFASGAAAALLAATGLSAGILPKQGGKLRLALSGASRGDDWTQGDGLFMQVAKVGLVYETLTEVAADGTLRGELATDWTSSSDARVWTFDLRKSVLFHDGAPFVARDAVHSLAALGDIELHGSHGIRITLADPIRHFRLCSASLRTSFARPMRHRTALARGFIA
jgi:ABC-type transport system substrate-binding protein